MRNEGNGIITREINFAKIFILYILKVHLNSYPTNRKGGINDDRYSEEGKCTSVAYASGGSGNRTDLFKMKAGHAGEQQVRWH
ncbi:hypothetical protein CD32_07895 [Lysinibacillus odysseyi 34hs-1 = NBRC 100172]|uniref:Uncharacterized protein n=1 Tax=Lysinibacillus odysseyi 34hs-1 = NBRC 100172 TaxID=1220589 RepID=A0A0A3ISC8_9BACI|nr:hypothetical protein CD32_07895 [Lysinibacillus odysseyi 34hs-1 = NBRC 100172]